VWVWCRVLVEGFERRRRVFETANLDVRFSIDLGYTVFGQLWKGIELLCIWK
jgi:hypothetical protein